MKLLLTTLLAGLAGGGLTATAASPLSTELVPGQDWIVRWAGKPVCVYHFGPDKKKPYVQQLSPLGGENILRDSPSDHLHHHALMYGIRVNGVNFWEEAGRYGLEKPVEVLGERVGKNRRGHPQATFRQRLLWVPAAANARPLLQEDRTLVVIVDESQQEVALIWRSRFELAPGVERVKLEGANYHGLGLRFLEELDPLAVHWVEGEKLDLGNNRQDVRPGRWAAVTFDRPGQAATVALAGSPANRGAPSHFFSMLTPFAYLSATQNLDQTPLEYTAGETWTLTYLVLLYPEVKSPAFLKHRVASWTRTQGRQQPSPKP